MLFLGNFQIKKTHMKLKQFCPEGRFGQGGGRGLKSVNGTHFWYYTKIAKFSHWSIEVGKSKLLIFSLFCVSLRRQSMGMTFHFEICSELSY